MADKVYQIAMPRHICFGCPEKPPGLRATITESSLTVWRTPDAAAASSLLSDMLASPSPSRFIRHNRFSRGFRVDEFDFDLLPFTTMVMFLHPTKRCNRVRPMAMQLEWGGYLTYTYGGRGKDGKPDRLLQCSPLPHHLQHATAPIFEYLDLTSLG